MSRQQAIDSKSHGCQIKSRYSYDWYSQIDADPSLIAEELIAEQMKKHGMDDISSNSLRYIAHSIESVLDREITNACTNAFVRGNAMAESK